MKLALGFFLFLFSTTSFAATLTATSSCALGGMTVTGTTSCSLGGLSESTGSASARIDLSSTFPSSAFQSLVIGIESYASTRGLSAIADTSGTYTLELATTGPVRTGYVVFATSGSGTGSSDGFTGIWNLDLQRGSSLSDVSGGCGGAVSLAYNCGGSPITNPYWPYQTPITLGTTLSVTATASADAYQFPLDGGPGGQFDYSVSIQFFELDGTPVQILDASAPEPATWTLAALPLALFLWRYRKFLP